MCFLMCGRFYVDEETVSAINRIIARVDTRLRQEGHYKGDIYPSQKASVLRSAQFEIGEEVMTWGFPPLENKRLLINARAETIASRPTFKDSLRQRRCVIPCGHFYEWNAMKEKVSFNRTDSPVLYMAGIYNTLEGKDRFVIITTHANASMRPFHHRMPLILEEKEMQDWLFEEEATNFLLCKRPVNLVHAQDYEQQSLF